METPGLKNEYVMIRRNTRTNPKNIINFTAVFLVLVSLFERKKVEITTNEIRTAASFVLINPYKIKPIDKPLEDKYDVIIIAVAHDEFKTLTEEQIRNYGKDNHVLYDIKYLLKENESDGRL